MQDKKLNLNLKNKADTITFYDLASKIITFIDKVDDKKCLDEKYNNDINTKFILKNNS